MTKHRETTDPELVADSGEPWIGVHTLSEFAFCPRAGVCSHDKAEGDDGAEPVDRPGFYHLPIFFVEEMNRRQTELIRASWISTLCGLVLLLGAAAAGLFVHSVFYVAAMLCGAVTVAGFATQTIRIGQANEILRQWKEANSEIPDADIREPTPIHWPNFLVADYEPERPRDNMEQREWKLCGKPWRVLRRGKEIVPVFLRNVKGDSAAKSNGQDPPRLYDQHFVRIAAYCYLAEVSQGLNVPYGIVLTRGSLSGMAIPNTGAIREQFLATLAEARRTMRDLADNSQICPSADEKHCFGCPHGCPAPSAKERHPCRSVKDGRRQGNLKPYHVVTSYKDKRNKRQWRRFHSHCGDRFKWLPPHELADLLSLEEF